MDELFKPTVNKKDVSNFSNERNANKSILIPLAEKMRPENLEEIVGQEHLLGKGKLLRNEIENYSYSSLILW